MPTLMPKDTDNNVIPAIRLKTGGAQTVAVSGTSARTTNAFNTDTRIVSLYATQPVYVAFGDATITATTSDHYFPAGLYYDFAIGGGPVHQYSHVAVLQVSTGGTLYVSEKE